jgi:hypothetical protein
MACAAILTVLVATGRIHVWHMLCLSFVSGLAREEGLRELLISYGKSGYVALYSYEQRQDVVLVLAIRHQREAGCST